MPLELVPGTTVSRRYVIKRKLGTGGMAEVHLAYDPKLDLDVALKVLPPTLLADPSFLARFRREGQTLARLNHPHILRLYEIGEDEESGLYYLVLEYLSGGTLKERLTGTAWPVGEVVGVLRPVAAALDYAHGQSPAVVHRDLKPANIMFGEGGRVVVSDFGLARILAPEEGSADRSLSLSWGRILGTPSYMATEQAEGRPATPASDRYALGVVAYELLVGGVPFAGETPEATLIQIATKPLPLPRERNPRLDEAIERVVLKALARDPEARHASGEALVAGLEAAGQLTLGPGATPLLLRVEGSPAGAEVLVDGEPRGRMPCTVLGLRGGPHTVRVAAEGHEPCEQGVVLPRAGPLVVQLQPFTYGLEIRGLPEGATVAVDGAPAGTLPCRVEGLLAGEHRVSVRHPGYESAEEVVTVPRPGPVVVELERARFDLAVQGTPEGAEVWIDGAEVGRLPLVAKGLAAGTHRVRVAHRGYRAVERVVEVPGQTSVEVALERAGGSLVGPGVLVGAAVALVLGLGVLGGAVVVGGWGLVPAPSPATPEATVSPEPTPTPTLAEAWEVTEGKLAAFWGSDWGRALQLLGDFLDRYPDDGRAKEKKYAALVALGEASLRGGEILQGVAYLEQARDFLPDRGEAVEALLALTPTPTPAPPTATPRPPATRTPIPQRQINFSDWVGTWIGTYSGTNPYFDCDPRIGGAARLDISSGDGVVIVNYRFSNASRTGHIAGGRQCTLYDASWSYRGTPSGSALTLSPQCLLMTLTKTSQDAMTGSYRGTCSLQQAFTFSLTRQR